MTRVEVLPEGWNMPLCIADCHTKNAPSTEAERVANAAFIVRAVNSHHELVTALKDELDALELWSSGTTCKADVQLGIQISRDKIRRALKLAGVEI